jgi:hypothetical protein
MRQTLFLSFCLMALVLSFGMSSTASAQGVALDPVVGNIGPMSNRGVVCGGGEIYDDGTAENGYSGNAAIIDDFQGMMLFTPAAYPASYSSVCVGLVSLGGANLDFQIEVRDDDGAGGVPGTLLGSISVSVSDLPAGLPCNFYEFDISSMNLDIADGDVYIGVRWNPMDFPSRFICADETGDTPLRTGYVNFNNPDNWESTQSAFPAYRAKQIRAVPGEPAVGINPDPLDFGDQEVGTTSAAQSVTVENTGDAVLNVDDVSAPGGDFAAAGGSCGDAPFSLNVGASCTLDYQFSPTGTGAVMTSISITSNAATSPDSFDLQGTGIQAGVALGPDPLDFSDQEVGTTSAAQSVTVENTGDAVLNVDDVSAPGGDFAATGGSCGAAPFSLNAGASCTLDYEFSPTGTGAAMTSISVTSNAATSPDSFDLQGTGIQAGLVLGPDPLDFGDQEVGTTSTAQSVTVENTGDAVLNVDDVSAPGGDFVAAGGSCGAAPFSLNVGASCTLDYQFSPTGTGAAMTSISITSNAATSPDSFDLQGTGIQAQLALDASNLDMGAVAYNEAGSGQITVSNNGDAALVIDEITAPALPFSLSGGTCLPVATLQPGESCTILVSYQAGGTAGTFTSSFDIVSNAPSSPDTVALRGTTEQPIPVPLFDSRGLLLLILMLALLGITALRRGLI